jgi:arsenite-transporting ATPase
LFFTGKGGVGKTSISTATAIALADAGRRVLLVSTDAASNLDEMLGVPLSQPARGGAGVPGLSVLNIDPDSAAESYRQRVLEKMGPDATTTSARPCASSCPAPAPPRSRRSTSSPRCWPAVPIRVRPRRVRYGADRPHAASAEPAAAWSGFLQGNDRGASCLGPHSGLKMQEARFNAALAALSDPTQTTVVLVTRPERRVPSTRPRAPDELRALGLGNQRLVINGCSTASRQANDVAAPSRRWGARAAADAGACCA